MTNLNFANIFYTQFGANPPNLQTVNISSYTNSHLTLPAYFTFLSSSTISPCTFACTQAHIYTHPHSAHTRTQNKKTIRLATSDLVIAQVSWQSSAENLPRTVRHNSRNHSRNVARLTVCRRESTTTREHNR